MDCLISLLTIWCAHLFCTSFYNCLDILGFIPPCLLLLLSLFAWLHDIAFLGGILFQGSKGSFATFFFPGFWGGLGGGEGVQEGRNEVSKVPECGANCRAA